MVVFEGFFFLSTIVLKVLVYGKLKMGEGHKDLRFRRGYGGWQWWLWLWTRVASGGAVRKLFW